MKEVPAPPSLPFPLYVKPSRVALAIFLCLLFITGAVFMLTHAKQMDDPGFAQFISIVTLIFFGGGGVLFLVKLSQRQPIFTLTTDGIQEKPGILTKWSEINNVEICKFSRQKFVAVFLTDPEGYITRNKRGKGNMTLIGTPLVLNGKLGGVDSITLFTWLNFYLEQYRKAKN